MSNGPVDSLVDLLCATLARPGEVEREDFVKAAPSGTGLVILIINQDNRDCILYLFFDKG